MKGYEYNKYFYLFYKKLGANPVSDTEIVGKFEIMDGSPFKSICLFIFLFN